jgi:hypothetical protein
MLRGLTQMKWTHWLLPLAAALPFPCLADDGPGRPIAVQTKAPGAFEVVFHRTDANFGGAALFGIIGVSVQEGVQTGQDSDLAKKVLPQLTETSCGKPLVEAMTAKLQEAGFTVGADAKSAPVVVIEVKECSLRLVDTAQMHVASYVNIALGYRPPGARVPEWTETIQITGKARRAFDDFVNEAGLAQAELTDALKRAGGRAANKLIYRDNKGKS